MEENILANVWPEWRIVRRIGRGSYGTVYEAVRQSYQMESRAAVKVISIPQNESEIDSLRSEGMNREATRRYLQTVVNDFVSEIQLMESFKGTQNIVSVEDYKVIEKTDTVGWDIYIRMELLTPLTEYVSGAVLPEKDVVKLGRDICSALELCAKCNVIHRDIKPENIFVNGFGDFKLGDFGIARKLENVSGALSQKGTYYYMAPEVEKGTQYTATADIYSLGLVLYRFMNGNRLPFLPPDSRQLDPNERMRAVRRRLDGEPLPSPQDASPAVAEVILQACAPNPEERYPTAGAMKKALYRAAGETGGAAHAAADRMEKTVAVTKASQEYMEVLQNVGDRADQEVDTFNQPKKSGHIMAAALVIAGIVLAGAAGILLGRQAAEKEGPGTGSGIEDSAGDASRKATEVVFERKDDRSGFEYAVLTAVDGQDEVVWTYTTAEYPAAQLEQVNEIGTYDQMYYINDGGTIRVFNVQDGSQLWTNNEFDGSVTAKTFDEEGTLYLCGYLGPDLFIVDAEGRTVKRVEDFDQDYFWPVDIHYYGEQVGITFEGTPSTQMEEIFVSLSDYTASIPQNTVEPPAAPPNASATVQLPSPAGDQTPGVADVLIAEVYASSYLSEPQYQKVHSPANALDGKNSTAWVEGAAGQGVGESLVVVFSETCEVSGFVINAGYQKNSDIYQKNSRPAQLAVSFSDGSSLTVDLSDYNGPQQVTFEYPAKTSSITFSINSVYAGSKYEDTAISEISFF